MAQSPSPRSTVPTVKWLGHEWFAIQGREMELLHCDGGVMLTTAGAKVAGFPAIALRSELQTHMGIVLKVLSEKRVELHVLVTESYREHEGQVGALLSAFARWRIQHLNGREVAVVHAIVQAPFLRSLCAETQRQQAQQVRRQTGVAGGVTELVRFREIVGAAVRAGASDIHICARKGESAGGRVLFRVNGGLVPYNTSAAYQYDDLVHIISAAYMSLDITEERSRSEPLYSVDRFLLAGMQVMSGDQLVRLRFIQVPLNDGVDGIYRLLPSHRAFALEDLGYAPNQIELLRTANRAAHGGIVIGGTTGSGKTTTLAAMLTEAASSQRSRKFYSVEDPVEVKLFGVSQIPVQRSGSSDTGDEEWGRVLKALMRADPDKVMIGEVRDRSTAESIEYLIDTGHMTYLTVHVTSAMTVIPRLAQSKIGLPLETLTRRGFLRLLVAQALLPKLCPHCAIPAAEAFTRQEYRVLYRSDFEERQLEYLQSALVALQNRYRVSVAKVRTTRPGGCEHCHRSGVAGRTVAAEMLTPTVEWLDAMAEHRFNVAERIWRDGRSASFDSPDMCGKTALEHAIYKVAAGEVDPLEVEAAFEPLETAEIYGQHAPQVVAGEFAGGIG